MTTVTLDFLREQVAVYDLLPPAVRRAIAEAPHPVDAVGVLAASRRAPPGRRERAMLAEVEHQVAYMSQRIAAMYQELLVP